MNLHSEQRLQTSEETDQEKEWINLIWQAKQTGLSAEEVREFLKTARQANAKSTLTG